MKRTYFFNLLKMKMLSIRLIISVFCMVFMNFLVVMPDIRANYDTLDIVYLFRFTYDERVSGIGRTTTRTAAQGA